MIKLIIFSALFYFATCNEKGALNKESAAWRESRTILSDISQSGFSANSNGGSSFGSAVGGHVPSDAIIGNGQGVHYENAASQGVPEKVYFVMIPLLGLSYVLQL